MAESRPLYVFPSIDRITVYLSGSLLHRIEPFARQRGWTVEQSVQAVLAYAAAAARGNRLSPEAARNELAAARSELAMLEHRAFVAEDIIQSLRIHLTSLETLVAEGARLHDRLVEERVWLRHRQVTLAKEAARRGVSVASRAGPSQH